MKKRLLIVTQNQFGYHVDALKYCEHLTRKFEITYICWDYTLKRLQVPGVCVIYIRRSHSLAFRNISFIYQVVKEIKKHYHLIFIKYFNGCSMVKFFSPGQKIILDVRSGIISSNKPLRLIRDCILKIEALFFDHISIISESLANRFFSKSKKIHILPLGADVISNTNKKFDNLHLLYVGTFNNRNILESVKGFNDFFIAHRGQIDIKYSLVGSGSKNEEEEIDDFISQHNLESIVKRTGYVPHQQLKSYFDSHNIGISFIPLTEYFDCQPPTKTFEYILSGLPVLATNTSENKKIITKKNGHLIDDTRKGFYDGMCFMHRRRLLYNSEEIRRTCENRTWSKIIENNLIPYLDAQS